MRVWIIARTASYPNGAFYHDISSVWSSIDLAKEELARLNTKRDKFSEYEISESFSIDNK